MTLLYTATLTTHYVYYTVVDGTSDEVVVGSLNYDNNIIDEDRTYILAGYTIPCNGTVVAWEFCYQIGSVSSATFYPGIWRITDQDMNNGDTDCELVRSTNVTFNPTGTSSSTHPCQNYTLSKREQFIALSGSVIGLYSNKGVVQPLLLRTDNNVDDSAATFQFGGSRSSVDDVQPTGNVNYNIAIRVHLSK